MKQATPHSPLHDLALLPRSALLAGAAICALFWAVPVFAADGASQMEWGVMGMQLFGGLALFLFGMEQMTDALKAVAGERMKEILGKLT